MLLELRLKNFIFIKELSLDFTPGLNILTGETGAGKSIIISAINLLLGQRVKEEVIPADEDKATIEGIFDLSSLQKVKDLLIESGIENGEELLIRREISKTSRHKIYLNGQISLLPLVQKIGQQLVDFHGQHEHQSLLRPQKQLFMLDKFGKLQDLANSVQTLYSTWQEKKKQTERLKSLEKQKREKLDFLQFQLAEIEKANLKEEEEKELEAERNRLKNAEKLYSLSKTAYFKLYEKENSVIGELKNVLEEVKKLAQIDPTFEGEVNEDWVYQLQDLTEHLLNYQQKVVFNPQRLEEIERRLFEISQLKRKYQASVEEIIKRKDFLKREIEKINSSEEELEKTEQEVKQVEAELREKTEELSVKRKIAAQKFEQEVEKELVDLGMKKTKFQILFKKREDTLSEQGAESVEFMIAPNVGEKLRPLAKIASGGELSRVMLALKKILGKIDQVPTLIFDEIDAGIGGKLGQIVGRKLKTISQQKQVICITHLPQIASSPGFHYQIIKEVRKGKTFIYARKLTSEEKIKEVARMLAGEKITPTALQHAYEMIEGEKDEK